MFYAYFIHLIILILIYLIVALSLQLVLGYGGMLNFSLMAFFGIGAYSFSLLALNNFSFFVSIFVACFISAIFGLLLSLPTNKTTGDYLALVTLGFSYVAYAVFLNWNKLTKGAYGLADIPRPHFWGLDFSNNNQYIFLVLFFAVIIFLIIYKIVKSPFGLALMASRDNELACRSLGKNTFKLKTSAIILAAIFTGLAGGLYASYVTYIDPASFAFSQFIPILVIVLIGGLANLKGTILATIILVLLPEPLRLIGFSSAIIGPMRIIIYSLILLLILFFRPKGFLGKIDFE